MTLLQVESDTLRNFFARVEELRIWRGLTEEELLIRAGLSDEEFQNTKFNGKDELRVTGMQRLAYALGLDLGIVAQSPGSPIEDKPNRLPLTEDGS